jgi:putative FmdB family regulatory protein
MPTYDYRCLSCKHEFELVQKMSDPPRKRCPKCGKKVERLIGSGAGLLFKGSGFYITDYRSSEYKAKAKAEMSPAGGAAGGSKSAAAPAPAPKEAPKEGARDGSKPASPGSESGTKTGSNKDSKSAESAK